MKEMVLNFEVFDKFKEHLILSEKSENTIQKYLRDVTAFSEYVGCREITKETVIGYKRYLQEKYKVRTVNSVLASLNCLFSFLGWYDLKVKSLKLQK